MIDKDKFGELFLLIRAVFDNATVPAAIESSLVEFGVFSGLGVKDVHDVRKAAYANDQLPDRSQAIENIKQCPEVLLFILSSVEGGKFPELAQHVASNPTVFDKVDFVFKSSDRAMQYLGNNVNIEPLVFERSKANLSMQLKNVLLKIFEAHNNFNADHLAQLKELRREVDGLRPHNHSLEQVLRYIAYGGFHRMTADKIKNDACRKAGGGFNWSVFDIQTYDPTFKFDNEVRDAGLSAICGFHSSLYVKYIAQTSNPNARVSGLDKHTKEVFDGLEDEITTFHTALDNSIGYYEMNKLSRVVMDLLNAIKVTLRLKDKKLYELETNLVNFLDDGSCDFASGVLKLENNAQARSGSSPNDNLVG